MSKKVLLVASGHSSSSLDIFQYYNQAFRDVGATVRAFRYELELNLFVKTIQTFRETEEEFLQEAMFLAAKSLMGDVAIFRPDYIVIVTGITLHPGTLTWIRDLQKELTRPPKVVIILTESDYESDAELAISAESNVVFTNERMFLGKLRRIQRESYYLPHAYSERVHHPAATRVYNRECVFVGSGFPERIALLRDADIHGMELFGYFPDLEEHAPGLMDRYVEGLIPNSDVAEFYRTSKVNLNFHRISGKKTILQFNDERRYFSDRAPIVVRHCQSVNNRAIEIAACGGFQLCDNGRPELQEIFGDSIPIFSTSDGLGDLVKYYADRDTQREGMADRALGCVQGRTYANNARYVLEKLAL